MTRLILAFALAAFGALAAAAQGSDGATTRVQAVKAAYLYKFAHYVEWPAGGFAGPDSPLVIGVIGADSLAAELRTVSAGLSAGGRRLSVRVLQAGEPLGGLHMLYLGRLEKPDLVALLAQARGRPILTVSESEEARDLGSMVNFLIIDERLRFEVALRPVRVAGLRISALMLEAAFKVAGGSS